MKSLLSVITAFQESRTTRQNLRLLLRFMLLLAGLVTAYSLLFHVLMHWEGREHSWLTGFYWTLTVMSTLGFGDITFESDLGRAFSMVVLVSGVFFMLVLLPFTFIEFFYAPWMRAQAAARAPRELPATTRGHVILTRHDAINRMLVPLLQQYGYQYVVLVTSVAEAMELHDAGTAVAVGDLDDPETYRRLQTREAALVVAMQGDKLNTNVTFTVRELTERVPVVVTATCDAARDVLELAGANHVLRPEVMMGQALARRVNGTDAVAHVVGEIDGLVVAEANAAGTPLVGKRLGDSFLRKQTGVNVIGVWEQGKLVAAWSDTLIRHNTVFVLAGTQSQLDQYNEMMCIYHLSDAPVLIVGGGGVGRAVGEALVARGLDYRVIEKEPGVSWDPARTLVGDASEVKVLERAELPRAASLIITTHDDDTNIYLTILCRRLRPDLQIISRCTAERNVATLHRAGADLVLSYGSMGANAIFNLLRGRNTLLMGEGVSIFSVRVPPSLAGKTLAQASVRSRTGCTVIAVESEGRRAINPAADHVVPPGGELFLMGTLAAEEQFLETFVRS